ncbi:hypothetical protein BKA81DRAFT_419561 [Phyllosticta paracitricarpa]
MAQGGSEADNWRSPDAFDQRGGAIPSSAATAEENKMKSAEQSDGRTGISILQRGNGLLASMMADSEGGQLKKRRVDDGRERGREREMGAWGRAESSCCDQPDSRPIRHLKSQTACALIANYPACHVDEHSKNNITSVVLTFTAAAAALHTPTPRHPDAMAAKMVVVPPRNLQARGLAALDLQPPALITHAVGRDSFK